ncbi:MAG TPA: Ger(x)C family spore germination protein [Bacillota bacterium]|nr:Ger(x)C family spore germination protein [Bacillota bacterium]
MRKNKKFLFLLCLFYSCILLNGCWDRRELESLGLVQSLGLDMDPKTKQVTVTTMLAIPSKLGAGTQGGGGGGDESSVEIISMPAPSIYEAFNLINTTINREITLQQNQNLIIGEELAKQGIRKFVDNLVRFREIRRTLLLFVCQGKAADIFQVQPKLEKNPAEYFNDLVGQSVNNAMFPRVNLNEFMNNYEAFAQENYAPLLAQYTPESAAEPKKTEPKPEGSEGGDSSQGGGGGGGSGGEAQQGGKPAKAEKPKPTAVRIIGTAVFRGDKMVGNLDIYESQILQLLTNHFKQSIITLEDPLKKGYSVVVRLIGGKPTSQVKYKSVNGIDRLLVKTSLEADLISIQSGINYTDPRKQTLLANQIARELQNRIRKVINKAQQDFKSDIFGLGIKVRNTMLTTEDWEIYHWPDKFPQAQIDTRVKVAIRRVGVQFEPPILR